MFWADQDDEAGEMGHYDWLGGACFLLLGLAGLALVALAIGGALAPVR